MRNLNVALFGCLAAVSLCLTCSSARATLNLAIGPGADIQNAVDRIVSAGGGILTLHAGTYNITRTISLGSNIRLSGTGRGKTILKGPSSSYGFALIEVHGDNIHNVAIEQMTIDGNIDPKWSNVENQPYVDQSGIHWFAQTFEASGDFGVNHVEVLNCTVGMLAANIKTLTIDSCEVHDCGMWIRSNLWQHNININACSDVTISKTDSYRSLQGSGIHLYATTGNGGNWTVRDCAWIGDNAQCGIHVQSDRPNITIRNNRIGKNGFGDVYKNNSYSWDGIGAHCGSSCVISGNTCADNKGWGIRLYSGSGACTDNTCAENGPGSYCISGSWSQSGNK